MTGASATFLNRFSYDTLRPSWQAEHFGRVYVHLAYQAPRFKTYYVAYFATRIFTVVSSGDNMQLHGKFEHRENETP